MEILIALLCASQAVQSCALVWVVLKLQGHERVISDLPELLKERDQAMVEDFKKATFAAINAVMEERADRKAAADVNETSAHLGRARRSTDIKGG